MFPFFSVIIPTYNRPKQLDQCLQSFRKLEYPKEFLEVIIVDDGSKTNLNEIISKYSKDFEIRLFKQKNSGPATARNFGASKANGNYFAFTDDDCLPAPDWLLIMAKQIERTPTDLLGGKTINFLNNIYSATSQTIVEIVYDHYNVKPNNARFFASNNMIIPRNLFEEINGFLIGWYYSEDRELCNRWLLHGYNMKYVEEAIIYHGHHLTFWGFCKQHFSYGKGAYHFHHLRKQRKSGTIFQEISFHANLKNWLFQPFIKKKKQALFCFFLLIVWQICNLLGYITAFISKKSSSRISY